MDLYPLRFEPILKAKVWGGRALEGFHKDLPAGEAIGESWEIADLDSTSPSGGGGDSAHSVIAGGPLWGRTIRDAAALWGKGLLGETPAGAGGAVPLLVKLLDANENLSVQVHPSPAYAAAHPGALLKTESWLVLEARPGAVLYLGLREGVTPDALRAAIEGGGVPGVMTPVPARPGDCHHLPSGVMHALGGGVVVAEVQTPSDTTFRVYDWGRLGREMHVEQALECAQAGTAPAAPARHDGPGEGELASTDAYVMRQVNVLSGAGHELSTRGRAQVVMAIRGAVELNAGAHAMTLRRGETALVPAGMERFTLTGRGGDASALVAQVGA